MALTAAVAGALWWTWYRDSAGTGLAIAETGFLIIGIAAFVAARGCYVEIDQEKRELRDVVAWITRMRLAQTDITEARVRPGPWRWFELSLADGRTIVVAGASPVQFPARLLPGAAESDAADLEVIMGPDDG